MDGLDGTYPLHIELRWLALIIQPIAIYSGLVDLVKLPLVIIEICLSERPRRCDRKLIEIIADADQDIVDAPPLLRNDAFPLQHDVGPHEDPVQELRHLITALGNLAICGKEPPVLSLCVDFLQLSLKLLNLGGVEL